MNRVKRGDRLKYFKYKYILMEPLRAILTPVFLILIGIVPPAEFHPLLALFILSHSRRLPDSYPEGTPRKAERFSYHGKISVQLLFLPVQRLYEKKKRTARM